MLQELVEAKLLAWFAKFLDVTVSIFTGLDYCIGLPGSNVNAPKNCIVH